MVILMDRVSELVEQRISFLLDPAISHAFPISTSTSPTSALDNDTHTTVHISVLFGSVHFPNSVLHCV